MIPTTTVTEIPDFIPNNESNPILPHMFHRTSPRYLTLDQIHQVLGIKDDKKMTYKPKQPSKFVSDIDYNEL